MSRRWSLLYAASISVLVVQPASAVDLSACHLVNGRTVCQEDGQPAAETPSGEANGAPGQLEGRGVRTEAELIGQPIYVGPAGELGPAEEAERIGEITGVVADESGNLLELNVRPAGTDRHEVTVPAWQIELAPAPGTPAGFRLLFNLPPAAANGAPANGAPASGAVRSSRSFLGPHEFPPEAFAAYGIVAFPARAVAEGARRRHLDICRAYVATLPTPSELSVPPEEQMVTVWPVDDSDLAADLTERRDLAVCDTAVERYHLATALAALAHGELASGQRMGRRGPYLLAWSPSSEKGREDALVLVADLSTATAYTHFEDYFRQWREDIEQSPDLWERGWSLSLIRNRIRDWADRWGPILTLRGE